MIIDLKGKTALVTGSTGGIGLATAVRLAGAGAAVVLTGLIQREVDQALAAVRAAVPNVEAKGIVVDLSAASGVDALAAAQPTVDILVNSVGVYAAMPFLETEDSAWDRILQTNVMSGVRLSRAYLPGMLERNWGRIIFVSSESALVTPMDMIPYGVSKTAQLAVSRGLAKLAAGTGVTVNAILPGPTLTDGVRKLLTEQADREGRTFEDVAASFVRTARPSSLIQRFETPEEIANLITYVASPLSSGTTGAALRVDGGVVDTIG